MIVPPPRKKRSLDENILPLINVVFLLLIFFVIAGTIARDAPFDLTLPSTSRTKASATPAEHVLSVSAEGQLAYAGKPVEKTELTEILADWPENKALQIRADTALEASKFTALLERLRQAGITRVRLLTQHQAK